MISLQPGRSRCVRGGFEFWLGLDGLYQTSQWVLHGLTGCVSPVHRQVSAQASQPLALNHNLYGVGAESLFRCRTTRIGNITWDFSRCSPMRRSLQAEVKLLCSFLCGRQPRRAAHCRGSELKIASYTRDADLACACGKKRKPAHLPGMR